MANVFHILDIISLITGKRQDMIIDIPAVVVSIQINIWTDRPIGSGMDSFVREILFEKGPVFGVYGKMRWNGIFVKIREHNLQSRRLWKMLQ